MLSVYEGLKEDVRVSVARSSGSAAFTLTTPQRRILTSARALVAGYDWAACTWDGTLSELSALFDTTAVGLSAPGIYYVQVRGTIGAERVGGEVQVVVKEWGP